MLYFGNDWFKLLALSCISLQLGFRWVENFYYWATAMSETQFHEFQKQISDQAKDFNAKIINLSNEINTLRDGYTLINKRYVESLSALRDLTLKASEAAKRSAIAASFARDAAMEASEIAKEAGEKEFLKSAGKAAKAASAAAESASESAASAAAAAAAAASAVSHQAEESALRAAQEASMATEEAARAAAEAVKLSNIATEAALKLQLKQNKE